MKKVLMISVMLLVGALSVSAQTYCYKYLYSVNGDGVKSKNSILSSSYSYITFTNNKNACYSSDKDGFSSQSGPGSKAVYTKTDNGVIEYVQERVDCGMGIVAGGNFIYRFSSDFSRMNSWNRFNSDPKRWDVYERTTEPYNKKAPTQLY